MGPVNVLPVSLANGGGECFIGMIQSFDNLFDNLFNYRFLPIYEGILIAREREREREWSVNIMSFQSVSVSFNPLFSLTDM